MCILFLNWCYFFDNIIIFLYSLAVLFRLILHKFYIYLFKPKKYNLSAELHNVFYTPYELYIYLFIKRLHYFFNFSKPKTWVFLVFIFTIWYYLIFRFIMFVFFIFCAFEFWFSFYFYKILIKLKLTRYWVCRRYYIYKFYRKYKQRCIYLIENTFLFSLKKNKIIYFFFNNLCSIIL
jgi:hypothetical protein